MERIFPTHCSNISVIREKELNSVLFKDNGSWIWLSLSPRHCLALADSVMTVYSGSVLSICLWVEKRVQKGTPFPPIFFFLLSFLLTYTSVFSSHHQTLFCSSSTRNKTSQAPSRHLLATHSLIPPPSIPTRDPLHTFFQPPPPYYSLPHPSFLLLLILLLLHKTYKPFLFILLALYTPSGKAFCLLLHQTPKREQVRFHS